jgi:putative endonuclease
LVNNRHKTGKIGEQKALDFLLENNYEILFSNWRFQRCEIDIVAKKK